MKKTNRTKMNKKRVKGKKKSRFVKFYLVSLKISLAIKLAQVLSDDKSVTSVKSLELFALRMGSTADEDQGDIGAGGRKGREVNKVKVSYVSPVRSQLWRCVRARAVSSYESFSKHSYLKAGGAHQSFNKRYINTLAPIVGGGFVNCSQLSGGLCQIRSVT